MEASAKTTIRQSAKKVRFVLEEVRNKNVNDALYMVNANYYFLSDQDDIWVRDKLNIQMKFLQVLRFFGLLQDLMVLIIKKIFLTYLPYLSHFQIING